MDRWIDGRAASQNNGMKCVIYLSAEFLIGRALTNNMVNLGTYDDYAAALASMGLNLARIEEHEADAGLGNGGLGRLAACFLDSLSTLDYPAMGCGIRYEYGFFRQRIHDGGPRSRCPTTGGSLGLTSGRIERPRRRLRGALWRRRGGALGRDRPPLGGAPQLQERLRRAPTTCPSWVTTPRCRRPYASGAPGPQHRLDLVRFNSGDYVNATAGARAGRVHLEGALPRRQPRAGQKAAPASSFTSWLRATMQIHRAAPTSARHGDLHTLPEPRSAVQIERHPPGPGHPRAHPPAHRRGGLQLGGGRATSSARTFSYTNHTIMPEALERWDAALMREPCCPASTRIVQDHRRSGYRDRLWPATTPATCRPLSATWPSSAGGQVPHGQPLRGSRAAT